MERNRKDRNGGVLDTVAELFDLPADLVAGLPHLEMMGSRQLYLEHHTGILAYSDEQIDVNTTGGVLRVRGARLALMAMTAEELRIAVGRDSRLSGPSLQRAVLTGLVTMGAVAADCGMASTPAMFMATVLPGCDFDGAVMITASHLPQNRNGLKFFTREGGLESADIKELLRRAEAGPEAARLHGRLTSFDILTPYTAMLRQRIITGVNSGERPLDGLKIAVDAGNGAGGFYATRVLAPLGADISASVYLEPDGSFPTVKAPNPEDPNAFTLAFDLANKTGADLILATDPDSDRLGAAVRRRDGRFQVLTDRQHTDTLYTFYPQ